jgi:hypothetical protein
LKEHDFKVGEEVYHKFKSLAETGIGTIHTIGGRNAFVEWGEMDSATCGISSHYPFKRSDLKETSRKKAKSSPMNVTLSPTNRAPTKSSKSSSSKPTREAISKNMETQSTTISPGEPVTDMISLSSNSSLSNVDHLATDRYSESQLWIIDGTGYTKRKQT